jgi:hypothetical protein
VPKFAYTTVPGKIGQLLSKIREVGVPQKATFEWLKSIGFTSSNDRSLLAVLKQIGFIDGSGVPTERWRMFRGNEGKQVLAEAIRTGYAELYSTYPNAQDRSNSDLESFFRTHSGAGKQAIDKTMATFRALVGQADFSSAAGSGPANDLAAAPEHPATATALRGQGPAVAPVTVNINIQLMLPETKDEEVYRKFFAAMREHLLSPDR